MKLVFATNNQHKLEEIARLLVGKHEVVSLQEIGCTEEIPEDYDTLDGNALQKARHVKERYGYDCFADDTGLEIAALENRPGVYSARYAGENKNAEANMKKVLQELEGVVHRDANFRTVIALILGDKEYLFEGKVEGVILSEKHGCTGFGYDPIFQPKGFTESFAEMHIDEKNKISHRGRAVAKLCEFLQHPHQ